MKLKFVVYLILMSSSVVFSQGKLGGGVYGGVFFPLSNFSEFYNTGIGGNVQVTYGWSENTLLTFTVGSSRWNFDNDAFNRELENAGLGNIQVDLDAHFRVIPILVGVRWYALKGKSRPYILFEGGMYNYESVYQGTVTDRSQKPPQDIIEVPETKDSGTETALAIGVGNYLKLSNRFFFDVALKYNAITNARAITDPDDEQTVTAFSRTIQYITILAGINYRF